MERSHLTEEAREQLKASYSHCPHRFRYEHLPIAKWPLVGWIA